MGHVVPERGGSCVSEDRRALGGRLAPVRPARRTRRHPASRASCPGCGHRSGPGRPRRCGREPRARRVVPGTRRPAAGVHERAGTVRAAGHLGRRDRSTDRPRRRPPGRRLPDPVVAGRVRAPRPSRARGQGPALPVGSVDRGDRSDRRPARGHRERRRRRHPPRRLRVAPGERRDPCPAGDRSGRP